MGAAVSGWVMLATCGVTNMRGCVQKGWSGGKARVGDVDDGARQVTAVERRQQRRLIEMRPAADVDQRRAARQCGEEPRFRMPCVA